MNVEEATSYGSVSATAEILLLYPLLIYEEAILPPADVQNIGGRAKTSQDSALGSSLRSAQPMNA